MQFPWWAPSCLRLLLALATDHHELKHGDMNAMARVSALTKFRGSSSVVRQPNTKVLIIYDVQLKNNEVPHVPLVINYGAFPSYFPWVRRLTMLLADLPKAVEEYSHRSVRFDRQEMSPYWTTTSAFLRPLLLTMRALVLSLISLLQPAETSRCCDP